MSDASLTEVTFPVGTKHLGEWAFSKCKNLKSVTFEGKFVPGMFERGVFEGCDRLEKITFDGFDEDTPVLLAAAVSKLKVMHLLTADDVGEKSWYEKWDLALKMCLLADDAEGSIAAALCGEEDISYDGIGSVDGEMPGETSEFVKNAAMNKCSLCYLRLIYDSFLREETKEIICNYLRGRAFGKGEGYSWMTLKEVSGDSLAYYETYLEVIKPDRDTLGGMIEDLDSNLVAVKSFLIKQTKVSGDDLLNGLFFG